MDTAAVTMQVSKDLTITFTRASDAPDHQSKTWFIPCFTSKYDRVGVSEGYKKELEVIGVGYRATATGQQLELALGYSHPIVIEASSRN